MPGFKYNVVFLFGFKASAKYASFLLLCLYVFNPPRRPKLIHIYIFTILASILSLISMIP